MYNLYHQLTWLHRCEYVHAESFFLHRVGEGLSHFIVYVGIQQSASYVFEGFGNVDFGNLAFTFENFETAFKSVTKIFKHIYFLFFLLKLMCALCGAFLYTSLVLQK